MSQKPVPERVADGCVIERALCGCLLLECLACSDGRICDQATTLEPISLESPAAEAGLPETCVQALAVINSDYQSTSLSIANASGTVADTVFVSSATADAALSAALSGDVVLPASDLAAEIVLLDRFPASVITWLVPATAETRQLNVSTGFRANPHDYVSIGPDKAYVTRFGENFAPPGQDFDRGSDLLIIDPRVPEIIGSIDLRPSLGEAYPDFVPAPDRALRVGDVVYVALTGHSADFRDVTDSRLVTVDTASDEVTATFTLEGYASCGTLALSPDETRLAVSCTGRFSDEAREAGYPDSGVILLGRTATGLSRVAEFPAAGFGMGQLAESLAFIDDRYLLLTTFGSFGEGNDILEHDALVRLDLSTGDFDVLRRSRRMPFTLGTISCSRACGKCYLTDADSETPGLAVFAVSADSDLEWEGDVAVDTCTGLPPRQTSLFTLEP